MKEFTSKLLDIMIGVILGLGFQWWPNLHEPWQFIAFFLVYLLIIDYWIDTGSALKKFPPKREIDILIDVAVTFSFFLFIYYTQATIVHFLAAFIVFRVLDVLWILRVRNEYQIIHHDKLVMNTWLLADFVEAVFAAVIIIVHYFYQLAPLISLAIFIASWLLVRIFSSLRYKRVYFVQ